MVIGCCNIDGDFCSVGGGFSNYANHGVFMFGTRETIADFTWLAWCWCRERTIMGGIILDRSERVTLRSGEGYISRGSRYSFLGGRVKAEMCPGTEMMLINMQPVLLGTNDHT